jgi:hypothetical protein
MAFLSPAGQRDRRVTLAHLVQIGDAGRRSEGGGASGNQRQRKQYFFHVFLG